MYIIDIIPLKYIPRFLPQTYSYFNSEEIKKGALVKIPIGKKEEIGIVSYSREIKDKIALKKAKFETKPIKTILNPQSVITDKQLELAQFLSQQYLLPLSGVLKSLLPNEKVLSKSNISYSIDNTDNLNPQYYYLQGEDLNWLEEKISKTKNQTLIIFPNEDLLNFYASKFSHLDILILNKKGGLKSQIKEREDIRSGESKLIFGLRRCLEAPFKNLGLIILFAEEKYSFEPQQKIISFDIKTAVLKLAQMYRSDLIFQGNIPSIEIWQKIKEKKINLVKEVSPVDITNISFVFKDFSKKEIIFKYSQERIKEALKEKKKIFIFANRLGISPALSCSDCGESIQCPNCDSSLIYYQSKEGFQTRCRHCGTKNPPPNSCPNCKGHLIRSTGLGTQKILKELKILFPDSNLKIFDSDHIKSNKEEKEILKNLEDNKIDILIGTEIFLKYLKKPFFTEKIFDLSLIVSFGQLVSFPDFRTQERIRNLLINLSNYSNKVFIQNFKKDEVDLNNWLPFENFYSLELSKREKLLYPPFSELIKISFSDKNKEKVSKESALNYKKIKEMLSEEFKEEEFRIIPPLPSFISKIKNIYTAEIFLRIKKPANKFLSTDSYLEKRNKILETLPDKTEVKINPFNSLK